MYESCFIGADQVLELIAAISMLAALALIAAVDRQTRSARHYRNLYQTALRDMRTLKIERDDARSELMFPDRKELRHG
jgi:hypothetical protein